MTSPPLPAVLAGPILRRLTPRRLTIWLATRAPAEVRLELYPAGGTSRLATLAPGDPALRHLPAGARLHYLMIDLPLDTEPLPSECWIGYRLSLRLADAASAGWQDHASWAPDLCHPGRDLPGFMLTPRVTTLLHGSCRKPHHQSGDGLAAGDRVLDQLLAKGGDPDPETWPSALVMSGDQVYLDDVAGPMLRMIHATVEALGLPDENLDAISNTWMTSAADLYEHANTYYRRERLLPRLEGRPAVWAILYGGVEQPVFTADTADNHIITLAETLAMYLLVWSPALWSAISPDQPRGLTAEETERYDREGVVIDRFVESLPAVRRLLAHVPTAMIFDDHDVTDDWNLNRDWEEAAYENPFSRRVIGNALVAYMINQGWGNRPEAFGYGLLDLTQSALAVPGGVDHDRLIDHLLDFDAWDFQWDTEPALLVLDTRTRRWRSEDRGYKPSGLLDWEAVTDLQRAVRGRDSVILVSAAPIFGVKLIETVQRVFTMIGKPLMVDAEYWMAHPGTAEAVLNVFRHRKTPQRFVILSGDVHYSFVYDVELRSRRRKGTYEGPDIWQICSSGFKNEFPKRLLSKFDHLNRWLYAPRSPLNWLTRRRNMRVIPRKPDGTPHGRRLLNGSGIGLVTLAANGAPERIEQYLADGDVVRFSRREGEARWD